MRVAEESELPPPVTSSLKSTPSSHTDLYRSLIPPNEIESV